MQIRALTDETFCHALAPVALAIEWSVSVLVVAIEEVDCSWFASSTR